MVVVEEGTIRTKSRVEERTVNVKSVSIRLEPWQNISWKMFRDKNSTFLRYDRFKSIIIYLIKFVLPSESLLPCFTDRVNFWRRRKILPRNRQQRQKRFIHHHHCSASNHLRNRITYSTSCCARL